MFKIIKKFICFIIGHNVKRRAKRIENWNKTIDYYCKRCGKKLNIIDQSYNIKCLVSNKIKKLPLIKENCKTILVGYDNKIIKRHIIKHLVEFC